MSNIENNLFYTLDDSMKRINNRSSFFELENQQIIERRKHYKLESHLKKIIGLALSGGGIRSNAFQIGLLSGLYSGKTKTLAPQNAQTSLLNRIDYISSVSGGSWASGAYWSQNSDESFFSNLNEMVKNELNKRTKFLRTIHTDYKEIVELMKGDRARDIWEEAIVYYHLDSGMNNINVLERETFDEIYTTKPYLIINSTHSATGFDEIPNSSNLTFEFTPDHIGTIQGDKENKGFFLHHKEIGNKFQWTLDEVRGNISSDLLESSFEGGFLSLAMAHSSGIVGSGILSYDFSLRYENRSIEELQTVYSLTDGGKSENLGLLPLIERGVDLAIVSDVGENALERGELPENLELTKKQIAIKLDREIEFNKSNAQELIDNSITEISYKDDNKTKTIFYVKPSREFIKNNQSDPELRKIGDLVRGDKDFPNNPTFKPKYDENTIRAYYLLGKYTAERILNAKINEWLDV